MSKPIRRVAVLGSGVMGSGIAAHCANAGIPVLLLDIPPKDTPKDAPKSARNAIAQGALKKLLKSKPASFYSKNQAELVKVGNLEDNLEDAAKCDLIIEAVIERLDIKQSIFGKLEKMIGPDTIVASNTSGLRIKDMLSKSSADFKKRFAVMHFFNPPRYMKLLELVAGEETSQETISTIEDFGVNKLGKGIVMAKDCPNFVANRIGVHAMMSCMQIMLDMKLAPEDVDAITGIPMGHPKSATFRTGDMVGLDVLGHVAKNCYDTLTEDKDRDIFKLPKYIENMLEKKLLGNKTKSGFYKKSKAGIETYDPYKEEYRPKAGDADIKKTCKGIAKESDVKKRIKKLVETDGPIGEFAWRSISASLAYSANRLGEISDDVKAIDNGMCWGYNWELGPFQIWDALGFAETTARLKKDGLELPAHIDKMLADGVKGFYTDDNQAYDPQKAAFNKLPIDPRNKVVSELRKGDKPVIKTAGAEAWDWGDGVLGLTFTTKANSIDQGVIDAINQTCDKAEKDFSSIVIANQGEHFCVGANLFLVAMAAGQKKWDDLKTMIQALQNSIQRLTYSQVPVVAAPYGMTLGGGMEICFAADAIQAAAETYSGLVEVGVGLIPAGAGSKNMLWRAMESLPEGTEVDASAFANQTFKNIAMAKVATSATEAKDFGYFRKTDGISFDKSRLLTDAKARAVGMANSGYTPPTPRSYKLPGESGIATMLMMVNTLVAGGYASEHDKLISMKLANILCGGKGGNAKKCTEQDILDLECEAFLSLLGEQKTIDRIQHMLMKNKPLRN